MDYERARGLSDQLHNATVLPLPVLSATRGVQVLMRGLFQNRFRRASHGRRRSLAGSPVTSLEKLEPRLGIALAVEVLECIEPERPRVRTY